MPNDRRRVALQEARLTTRTVADARPRDRRYIVRDDELRGFGLRVRPSGHRSFIVPYRAGEGGRRAANRRQVLGQFPALAPARARSRAGTCFAPSKRPWSSTAGRSRRRSVSFVAGSCSRAQATVCSCREQN